MLGASQASADPRVVEVREVARGGYSVVSFAPDGRDLLLSGPKLRGLYLARVDGSAVRQLTDDASAGVHARFTGSSAIEYRALRAGVRRDLVIDRSGRAGSRAAAQAPIAFARDDRMYVIDRSGALTRIGSGDRFFGAVVSPDGDRVAFEGLSTGIYVYTRSTAGLVHVGPGTSPSWSPDGARLVYELTEDDGHEIVASDLLLYDAAGDRVQRLTATDAIIERRPRFSPDGAAIAYDDGAGAVFVGRVEVSR